MEIEVVSMAGETDRKEGQAYRFFGSFRHGGERKELDPSFLWHGRATLIAVIN